MKNFLIVGLTLLASTLFAQNDADYLEYSRSVLNAEKKGIISDAMNLTEDQSKVFWPLYNELNQKLFDVESKVYTIILDYAANMDQMTDEKADELWLKASAAQTERNKLLNSYYPKFKKVLPAGVVVKYYQVENKIDIMVDAALAMEIPLVAINPAAAPSK
ncbi:MAG: hypothetical protein KDC83_09625 [Flavobacteriales bacterium]|nr:hypothetical protein [Flavobacteriales bacterium]